MKRAMITVMSIILVLTLIPVAYAQDITPMASEIIITYGVSSKFGTGSAVKFQASITTYGVSDKLGFEEIDIQEYYNGSWRSVGGADDKYKTNITTYAYTASYEGVSGRKYRAVVDYYAKQGSTVETRTATSATITAK